MKFIFKQINKCLLFFVQHFAKLSNYNIIDNENFEDNDGYDNNELALDTQRPSSSVGQSVVLINTVKRCEGRKFESFLGH